MQIELRCAQCDYDLRMLDAGGMCPECAFPIHETARLVGRVTEADRRLIHRAASILLLWSGLRLGRTLIGLVTMLISGGSPRYVGAQLLSALHPWPLTAAFAEMYALQITRARFEMILIVWFACETITCLLGAWLLSQARIAGTAAQVRVALKVLTIASVTWCLIVMGLQLWATRYGEAFVILMRTFEALAPAALAVWAAEILSRKGNSKYARLIGWITAVGCIIVQVASWRMAAVSIRTWIGGIIALLTFTTFVWLILALLRLVAPTRDTIE